MFRESRQESPELKDRDEIEIHYCWGIKSSFFTGLNELHLPRQLTHWLLLIGLTRISLTKSSFNHPSVVESPLIGCHICNVMSQASTLSPWTEQNTDSHNQSNCLYPCLIPFNSIIHGGVWARMFKLLRRPRIDSKEPPIPLQAV
jgi:hypothetical protein